ncbi:Hypothetical protein CAP_4748 [Chondromyces apiculatus DSM 436]|uniref:Uncharacterized protein n=1 Tax=Chondromyces apiculatus DSM 436 TaxID=1192034 RepID=A0A017T6R3_9BACT|nr:Hypothetical protein CAP_4748 [Chondromyces apiculatus DSM 436]
MSGIPHGSWPAPPRASRSRVGADLLLYLREVHCARRIDLKDEAPGAEESVTLQVAAAAIRAHALEVTRVYRLHDVREEVLEGRPLLAQEDTVEAHREPGKFDVRELRRRRRAGDRRSSRLDVMRAVRSRRGRFTLRLRRRVERQEKGRGSTGGTPLGPRCHRNPSLSRC